MRSLQSVLAAVLVALPVAAHADWQWTSWGMSPADVVSASGGTAEMRSVPEKSTEACSVLVVAPYATERFAFSAAFCFAGDQLSHVSLDLEDSTRLRAADLIGALSSEYGEPESEHNSSIQVLRRWRDESRGNLIAFVGIGEHASVRYWPIPAGDSGL